MSRLNTDLVVKFAVRREFRHRAARGIGDDVRDKENGGEHEHVAATEAVMIQVPRSE